MKPDISCPIGCGRCGCIECSDCGKDGCCLSRDKRPFYCNSFFCEVSEDVRMGRMSLEKALEILPQKWGF